MATVLTIRQAAKALDLSVRVATEAFCAEELKGYRVPGSGDIRIPLSYANNYRMKHSLPLTEELKDFVDTFGLR